jgi:diguanylate cyclase (GGDEF)-like protein
VAEGDEALRSALGAAPLAVLVTDAAGVCVAAEGRAVEHLGIGASVVGRPLSDVVRGDSPLLPLVARALAGQTVSETVEVAASYFDILFRPLPGGGMAGTAVEVTERVHAEERVAHHAFFDSLTGLPNRYLLADRLAMAQARSARGGRNSALFFIAMDRLGRVNETLGHGAGDRLLVALAARLNEIARPADTIARFAGDKFIVLVEGVDDVIQATAIAERQLASLATPIPIGTREVFLRASIGVTLVGPGADPTAAMSDAESAMYSAKEKGGSRSAMFVPSMRQRAMARLETEQSLHRALENGELRVHFQPIINLDTGSITGLEALVRWEHPERGLVPPGQFIPLAEETGLIVPIGAWVLDGVARQLAEWTDSGLVDEALAVSVNLSAVQLGRPDLATTIGDTLERHGIRPNRVCLEITESALMDDTDAAVQVLSRLKELGVLLAVDDFGTGYSSLGYLHRLPIDALKVDQAFVRGLDHDPSDNVIAEAVVGLAHSFGLAAVGEGIETAGQLAELRRLGCDSGQGYFFAHPVEAADVAALLAGGPTW